MVEEIVAHDSQLDDSLYRQVELPDEDAEADEADSFDDSDEVD